MKLSLTWLLLFSGLVSFAQRYNIQYIGVKDGLQHSLVTGIDQDAQGRVWLSTGGGLCSYNGVDFTYITTRDGLNYTRLTDVVVELNGNVWTSSAHGVNLIRGSTITGISAAHLGEVTALGKSDKGVWALSNKGVFKIYHTDSGLFYHFYSLPSNVGLSISPIFQDRSTTSFVHQISYDKALIGYQGNLYLLNGEKIFPVPTDNPLAINATTMSPDGTVYLGTSSGLYRFADGKLLRYSHVVADNLDIIKLAKVGTRFWLIAKEIGAEDYGLFSIDTLNGSFKRVITPRNGLPDIPSKLFVDHEENLWVLTNNGIAIIKGEAFISYTTADGLVGNKIWGLCKTYDGALWAGTIGEGLSVITDKKVHQYTKKNILPDNYVGKIFQSSDGTIYVGTSNAGLCRAFYNPKTDSYSFVRLPLLPNEKLRIDDILEDEQGLLWIATSKGLFVTRNKRDFRLIKLFPSDTGGVFIQKLLLDDHRHRLWIGTRFNGIFYLEKGKTVQFPLISPSEEISTIAQDREGNIWFGTRNNGIFQYSEKGLKQIREEHGIASNLIYILYADRESLWVGTNLGLDRINLSSFRDERLEVRHYGPDEGLPDLETNLNGVLSDGENGFWLATNGGLARYQKEFDKLNAVPPIVSISDIMLRSQKTNWNLYNDVVDPITGLPDKLRLRYNQNHLTFEFIGVSFKNPLLVKYAWYMEGLENRWVESRNRQAIYSNLPPGNTYRFHLKAANADGVWSNEVVSIPIYIAPPFWSTWWFRIAVITGIVALTFLFISHRIKSLKEKQEELEAMVEQRTVELREQLEIVDEKNRQITDSIKYAKFLQGSMLPSLDDIKRHFSDAFVFYRPKDFVSGDFYWFCHNDGCSILAVADCTGHGVPGAIVSVICENALRTAVRECNFRNTSEILLRTNQHVVEFFSQSQKNIHDGMELALAIIDHSTLEMEYSGAKMPIYVISKGELIKLKPNIYRIGWEISKVQYSSHKLYLNKDDMIFAFTDGFGDQFGAESAQKFSSSRLKALLYDNSSQPYSYVEHILAITFDQWKGFYEQLDDVLVMGVKV